MLLTKTVIRGGIETPVEDLPSNSHLYVEVQCPVCGEVRTMHYSSYVHNKHDGACHKCAFKDKRKDIPIGTVFGRLTVIGNTEKDGLGYSICRCECGAVKTIKNTSLRRGHTVSCDCLRKERSAAACSQLMRSRPPEQHPRWIDGRSRNKPRYAEHTADYHALRQAVFDRDGGKCVICGSTADIQTHHLYAFADRPDLHTDADNMITVCAECHRRYHSAVGRKGVSPESFRQYAADNGATL